MKKKFFLKTIILLMIITFSGNSEDIKDFQKDVKVVISDQIRAFEAEDFDRAYSHASKAIKKIFPNSTVFGNMVMSSYPMIWSPKNYKFLDFLERDGVFVQRVLFMDQDNKIYIFDYAMEFSEEEWFINGVYPVNSSRGT